MWRPNHGPLQMHADSRYAETQPVHAFPNALLEADNLPLTIAKVSSIPVDVAWTYGLGNSNKTNSATADLVAASKCLS
jgi:hypothetical protein